MAWAPPLPTGDAPATAPVDAFEDGLAPFFGDPTRSRVLGKAVQITTGLLALYSVGRALAWLNLASLTSGPMGVTTTLAEQDRILAAGRLVDSFDALFWPTVIAMIVVDLLWRRARRPKDVLAARGEAYVEATIARAVPMTYRVVGAVFIAGGLIINTTSGSAKNLRPADISGYATTRALSSASFAVGWAMFILWVWASETHLARRVAKAMDPALAGYSVPYIIPEKEPGAYRSDSSEGIGWFLRTAGLILAAIVGVVIVIGALATMGKDPLASLAWLVGAGAVLGLVGWAFVRRWQRSHPSPGTP